MSSDISECIDYCCSYCCPQCCTLRCFKDFTKFSMWKETKDEVKEKVQTVVKSVKWFYYAYVKS